MLRGCWLLSWDWVEESQRAVAWQPESDYEIQVRQRACACTSVARCLQHDCDHGAGAGGRGS